MGAVAGDRAIHPDGTVLFPRTGCEELLQEVFGLGTEAHDDLVDALASGDRTC